MGFTLVELLVAMVLALLLLHAVATLFRTQSQAALRILDDVETMETSRIVRGVLGAELRNPIPGRDWLPGGDDTLSLRAFRGTGLVCEEHSGSRRFTVFYRGIREANEEKDSVLVLLGDGRWRLAEVERVDAAGESCAGRSSFAPTPELWTLDRELPGAVALRLFERGSYHVVDGALRYRRGLAGRQPLTPQRLDDTHSHLRSGENAVGVELHFHRHGMRPGGAGTQAAGTGLAVRWRIWPLETLP